MVVLVWVLGWIALVVRRGIGGINDIGLLA
jgi:hypothetical protein